MSLKALCGLVSILSNELLMRDARPREMKIIRIKAGLENLQIQFTENKSCKMYALIEPFTLKMSIVILLTVCCTILVTLVERIWS